LALSHAGVSDVINLQSPHRLMRMLVHVLVGMRMRVKVLVRSFRFHNVSPWSMYPPPLKSIPIPRGSTEVLRTKPRLQKVLALRSYVCYM
jgi:hypothetical protein